MQYINPELSTEIGQFEYTQGFNLRGGGARQLSFCYLKGVTISYIINRLSPKIKFAITCAYSRNCLQEIVTATSRLERLSIFLSRGNTLRSNRRRCINELKLKPSSTRGLSFV